MKILKMSISMLCFFLISMNLHAKSPTVTSIDFYKGSLEEAKKKASDEGKLFFVDFYAKWCAPCKWMDETTFADDRVVSMLNENFVSLKVDIDDFDGFALKQQYKIKYLPTILIFNANGELIDRVEETLSPRKLMEVLDTHYSSNHATPKVKSYNSSPSKTKKEIAKKEAPQMPADDFVLPDKDQYRVQVGLYSDFKNTFQYVNELKDQFAEPIIVLNDYKDGKIVYRIMIGEFGSKNEATSFVTILKNQFGISGIVK